MKCFSIGMGPAPTHGNRPTFVQMYIYDGDNDLANRLHVMPNLDREVCTTIRKMFAKYNPYEKQFVSAGEMMRRYPTIDVNIKLKGIIGGMDTRRYNTPTANEVAMIIPDTQMDLSTQSTVTSRDVLVTSRSDPYKLPNGKYVERLKRINPGSAMYEPLHYVMMLFRGTQGWSYDMQNTATCTNKKPHISLLRYMAYRLSVREMFQGQPLNPHSFGRLAHEYMVDSYARIEENNLNYARNHQEEFRGYTVKGLNNYNMFIL